MSEKASLTPTSLLSQQDLVQLGPDLSSQKLNDDQPMATPIISPAIARSRPSRIPQNLQPKKGILKNADRPRSTDPMHVMNTNDPVLGTIKATVSYTMGSKSPIPRPTVGWSEKNVVAIIGDTTSDEYESDVVGSAAQPQEPVVQETTLVEPPQKMVSNEPQQANYVNGFIMPESSPESTPERSVDDSKITEGRSTDDFGQSEDDRISVSSSVTSCGSHIAGKWWNGKDTRYVLHCEKKGCKHKHDEQPAPGDVYLTPTQRFKQEIMVLKKQKKKLEEEIKIKDRELTEHRDRIKQMDDIAVLAYDSELLKLLDQKEKKYDQEKRKLLEEHSNLVTKLEHVIFELKSKLNEREHALETLEQSLLISKADACTLTEPEEVAEPEAAPEGQAPPSHQATPTDPNPHLLVPAGPSTPSQQASPGFNMALLTQLPCADTLTEAFRMEAAFWREKASQLELIVREQLIRNDETATPVNESSQTGEQSKSASNLDVACEVVERWKKAAAQKLAKDPSVKNIAQMVDATSCTNQLCIDLKNELSEECDDLRDALDRQAGQLKALENEVAALKKKLVESEKEVADSKAKFDELAELAENRMAEIKSSSMAIKRIQEDKENMEKALSYLEDRTQAYRNCILENNLVVRGEEMSEWHRSFNDPRFQTFYSVNIQTDLTSESLSEHEQEFMLISHQLQKIQLEYAARQIDLDTQFSEITAGLRLKTDLVEKLSKQLESAARDKQLMEEHRQRERDTYQAKIDSMALELEKLPGLQIELQRVQQEKSVIELQFVGLKEHYEDGLESALNDSLKKYQEQDKYWQDKVVSLEQAKKRVQNELDKLNLDFEDFKFKTQVEKADLEQQLASSIEHVAYLNLKVCLTSSNSTIFQLNPPTRDQMCEAKPRTVNKYVACRPNQRHKNIQVEKKELVPSKSDENVAKLFKFKDAFMRTKAELSKIQETNLQQVSGKPKAPEAPSLKKAPNTLSLDQVSFEKSSGGVRLPMMRRDQSIEEISMASCPTVMIKDDEQSTCASTKTDLTDTNRALSVPSGAERVETEAMRASDQRSASEQPDPDQRSVSTVSSMEAIRQMDQQIRDLQDELFLLRAKAVEADIWFDKISQIQAHLPRTVILADEDDEQEPAYGVTAISQILDQTLAYLEEKALEEQNAALLRQSSLPDLTDHDSSPKTPSSATRKESRLQAVLVPNKWDNERQELLRQNAHYAAELLVLKAKLGRLMNDKVVVEEKKDKLDELEGDLKELARKLTTVPAYNAEQLAKARRERDGLRMKLIDMQAQLRDAFNELQIFRIEPRTEAQMAWDDIRLGRSRSTERVAGGASPAELRRWKEAAGTSFREVFQLRRLLQNYEDEVKNMRTSVAMLRGEMELAKCQTALANEWAVKRRFSKGLLGKLEKCKAATDDDINLGVPLLRRDTLPARPRPGRASSLGRPRRLSLTNVKPENPLKEELEIVRTAFHKQVSRLKERNDDLQNEIDDLVQKMEQNKKETIRLTEHEEILGVLNSKVLLLQNENVMYEMKIREIEDERQQMYLLMFRKGQQAAHHEIEEDKRLDEATEDKMLLKFLHDAFYYYLMNRGDSREHLQAIMTMLNFTSKQKDEVYRKRGKSH